MKTVAPHLAIFAALGRVGTSTQHDFDRAIGLLSALPLMGVKSEHTKEVIAAANAHAERLREDKGRCAEDILGHLIAALDGFKANNIA